MASLDSMPVETYPADEATEQKVVELAPPLVPEGKSLTSEERLRIENIYLKIQLGAAQVKELDASKLGVLDVMRKLQEELHAVEAELSLKYGTPVRKGLIGVDGKFINNGRS